MHCPHCLYDLRGAETTRCPECGLDVRSARITVPQIFDVLVRLVGLWVLATAAESVVGYVTARVATPGFPPDQAAYGVAYYLPNCLLGAALLLGAHYPARLLYRKGDPVAFTWGEVLRMLFTVLAVWLVCRGASGIMCSSAGEVFHGTLDLRSFGTIALSAAPSLVMGIALLFGAARLAGFCRRLATAAGTRAPA